MLNKKKLTVILLILFISLLSAHGNKWQEKSAFYTIMGNYQQHVKVEKNAGNNAQSESKVNIGEALDNGEVSPVQIPEQHIRVKYFDFCGIPGVEKCSMFITIYSYIECSFVLYDHLKYSITEGKLKIGQNKIMIPYDRTFISKDSHTYRFSIFYKNKTEEMEMNFKIDYEWPKVLDFDPRTGKINLKLKNEMRKILKYKSKIVLDKKVIMKSGLPNIILGVVILLTSRSLINRINEKMENRAVLTSVESSKRLLTTFGIGVTTIGLSSIFKALKKKELKGDMLVKDYEAVEYNKNLKKEYEDKMNEWKDKINAIISVIPFPSNEKKEVK